MTRDPERTDKAAALSYLAPADAAPKVVALGRGDLAKMIIETARAHGVAVYEDADLVELLLALRLGDEIPEPLYQAAADALAFVYRWRGDPNEPLEISADRG